MVEYACDRLSCLPRFWVAECEDLEFWSAGFGNTLLKSAPTSLQSIFEFIENDCLIFV